MIGVVNYIISDNVLGHIFEILLMMMMTNYGDNQDVAIEKSLYMMKKNINLSQVARFV